ncbi:MAG: aminoacyl-tRNA hydrolase [Clostridiales bacterium]|nr:aminoacyl-tRNA hydrolase [Clostridiales bacterium]
MPTPTTLIVGLGNPGPKYEHTRHNVGFDVLSLLAGKLQCPVKKLRHRALIGELLFEGHKVVLAAPQTYMNASGEAVSALMRWYHVPAERLLVIYDDVDLPPGTLRIRKDGSAGTHNGMRSIIQEIAATNFPRIRVGIGGKGEEWDLADWVLSHYQTPEERQVAFDAYNQAADAVIEFLKNGIESAMMKYNTRKPKQVTPGGASGETPLARESSVKPAATKEAAHE